MEGVPLTETGNLEGQRFGRWGHGVMTIRDEFMLRCL